LSVSILTSDKGSVFSFTLLTLAMIAWGMYNFVKLPVDAVPDITNNQVQVITISPSLAPQEVEQFITFPVEVAMANIQDVTGIRSISRFGLSVVTIVFKENVDILKARQRVSEQIKIAEGQIPENYGRPEMMPSEKKNLAKYQAGLQYYQTTALRNSDLLIRSGEKSYQLFVTACTSDKEKTTTVESKTTNGEVTLTKEQFQSAGIRLGVIEKHVLSNDIHAKGKLILMPHGSAASRAAGEFRFGQSRQPGV
jgi:Cu/Ag efflux pump CusA